MSVIYPAEWSEWWAEDSPRDCLLCGEQVDRAVPAVFWRGSDEAASRMVLHPGCAARLGGHLLMDAREADLASGRQPWARRAARATGHALTTAEMRS